MWRDVFINSGEAVLEMLQRFSEDLAYLQRAIGGAKDKLETLFSRTREIELDHRRRPKLTGKAVPDSRDRASASDTDGLGQIFHKFA